MATKKEEEKVKSVFETLNAIDVSKYTEKKGNLTYLSWAWAWGKVKENYPDATYKIYETPEGMIYHTDGRTAWVKTGVTINGIENIEYLPVMDNRNASITVDRITSRNVNDSIQRSLTKACARHGLGLYIYAGEDLPEAVADEKKAQAVQQSSAKYTQYGDDVINALKDSKTDADVVAVWNNCSTELQNEAKFRNAFLKRRGQVNGGK